MILYHIKFEEKLEELFYFHPKQYNSDPFSVKSVHIIGEFNQLGYDKEKLAEYKLTDSGKSYINYGKNITFKPEDFSDNFGIILVPEL